MKHFILKKDLPTFKAGDEFYLGESGHLFAKGANGGQDIIAYRNETLAKFPNILKDWFEEIPEKPKTVDDLRTGDKCYIAVTQKYGLYIIPATFCEELDPLRSVGSCYLTLDDGIKALKKAKAEAILRRDVKGFEPNWGDGSDKWEVVYEHSSANYTGGGLFVNAVNHCQSSSGPYFRCQEDAVASINAHRQEWLTYLGVEDEE